MYITKYLGAPWINHCATHSNSHFGKSSVGMNEADHCFLLGSSAVDGGACRSEDGVESGSSLRAESELTMEPSRIHTYANFFCKCTVSHHNSALQQTSVRSNVTLLQQIHGMIPIKIFLIYRNFHSNTLRCLLSV